MPINSFAGPYAACSAHLEDDFTRDTQRQQANEYSLFMQVRYGNIDRIASADFNLPKSRMPGVWESNYNAVADHDPDMIWVNHGAYGVGWEDTWQSATYSDHWEIQATFSN